MPKRRTRFGGGGRKSKQHHTRFGDGGTKRKKGAFGAHRYDHNAGTPKKDRPKRKKSKGKRRRLRYTIKYGKPKAASRRRSAPRAAHPVAQKPVAQKPTARAPTTAFPAISRSPRVLVPMIAPDLAARSPTITRALARVTAAQVGGTCPPAG